MARVVGTDPGTSSLDLLLLDGGRVAGQARITPERFAADPECLGATLRAWAPIDLIAGPSGYGLPLVRGDRVAGRELDLMALVRPEERGRGLGVVGFRAWVRALLAGGWPLVFLPGGVHLPTVPDHRKANAIDLGTPDKVAVVALALWSEPPEPPPTFAVVEVGSAFSAVLVIERGRLVDAAAGTRGPLGVRSGGAWDGEAAYWLGPLSKADLFRGGLADLGAAGPLAFRESLRKAVAGLRAVTPFDRLYLSGAAADRAAGVLDDLAAVAPLPSLPGARVKHAAQGAALIADGLLGGPARRVVASLELERASGTALDYLPRRPDG